MSNVVCIYFDRSGGEVIRDFVRVGFLRRRTRGRRSRMLKLKIETLVLAGLLRTFCSEGRASISVSNGRESRLFEEQPQASAVLEIRPPVESIHRWHDDVV